MQAQARERAAALVAEAEQRAAALEEAARAADAEAAAAQRAADRNAALVQAEADLLTWSQARDRLTAEAGDLADVIAEATERLNELAAQEAEAEQRQRMALERSDVAGVREVMLDRAAVAQVEAAERACLSAARARLADIDAELARAGEAINGLGVRVDGLRRELAGLPSRSEVGTVAAAMLRVHVAALVAKDPARLTGVMLGAVPEESRAAMVELIRLGPVAPGQTLMVAEMAAAMDAGLMAGLVAGVERMAAEDPAAYAAMRDYALGRGAAAARPEPDTLAPGYLPLDDGTLRYIGAVPPLGG